MGTLLIKIAMLALLSLSANLVMATNNSASESSKISAFNSSLNNTQPIILVVGDSISAAYGIELSEGWVALLEQKLGAKNYPYQVVNASVSGNTSADGLIPICIQYVYNCCDILLLGND